MSREMVLFEGSPTLGQPAVNRSCNSRSLMMLAGWLFLVTHLTRIFHWLFAFACEECEDGAAELGGLLASNSCVDCIFTEAAEGVVLEIGRGCFIF